MKFLLLSGSFHKKSKSLVIAEFVGNYLASHQVECPLLDCLPFYSIDLEQDKPEKVRLFLESVHQADGIICITPEYNHSVPAVLKNAIDWASRPAFHSPLKDKPVTIISQADSPVGGARVQAHLKLVFDATLSVLFPSHEMMLTPVSKIINQEGHLIDQDAVRRMTRHLDEFVRFLKK